MRIKNFILTILISLSAFGGDKEGNGGGGVVCRNAEKMVESVYTLDFYEANELYVGLKPDFGDSSLSMMEKVTLVLDRLKGVDAERRERWLKQAKAFMEEARFLPDNNLPVISDIGSDLFLPSNCKIQQIVIHKEPTLPKQKRYTVNKDLWDKMDLDNRAAMIIHEQVYRDAIALGAKDSYYSRYFNAHLFSDDEINKMKMEDYFDLITRTGFQLKYKGLPVERMFFFPSGAPRQFRLHDKWLGIWEVYPSLQLGPNKFNLSMRSDVELYESGPVRRIVSDIDSVKPFTVLVGKHALKIKRKDGGGTKYVEFEFHENNVVKTIFEAPSVEMMILGNPVTTSQSVTPIYFTEQGTVRCINTDTGYQLTDTSGKLTLFAAGAIQFDSEERAYRDASISACK